MIFAGVTGGGHLPISFVFISIIPQGITDFAGFEARADRTGAGEVAAGFGVFVIEGVGVLSVSDGLDGEFVVRGAGVAASLDGVAASLGDVEATGVVSSESRVSDNPHALSKTTATRTRVPVTAFLFMVNPPIAAMGLGFYVQRANWIPVFNTLCNQIISGATFD